MAWGNSRDFGKSFCPAYTHTSGAYSGVGIEERGQSGAITRNLRAMARLRTLIECVVIGKGVSGGRWRSAWEAGC